MLRELLNHGAQVDISQESGRTFISIHAERFYLVVIREVLRKVLSVDNIMKDNCASPIQQVKTESENLRRVAE